MTAPNSLIIDQPLRHGSRRATARSRRYTPKHCHPTRKSQITHMVADSSWEQYSADLFERSERVSAYAKNDHLPDLFRLLRSATA